jgi:diacylglycerol kinase (ATP)
MAKSGNTGFRRVVNATFYSIAGLRSAWQSEAAFRQECVGVVVLIPVALWLGQNAVERALLLSSCVLVVIVELLNTAVEFVVDRVGTDHHELSGRAKDAGSAAVFMSIALAMLVWGLVAWERFGPR